MPVVGLPTEDGMAVIASNYGQERHPAWFHNLSKDPNAEVGMDERTWRVRAVEAEGERRERIWQQALKVYPGTRPTRSGRPTGRSTSSCSSRSP